MSARAEDRPKVLVAALGDSTTAGTPFFRSPLESPPTGEGDPRGAYGYWIERRHSDWRVVNLGVAGQRTDQIAKRLDGALALKPDYLVVLAGVNDVYQGRSIADATRALESMYAGAAARGVRVVACTVLPYDGMSPTARGALSDLNAWIRRTAAAQGLLYCDTYSVVNNPSAPGSLAGTPDGLHPDLERYRAMGEAVARIIEENVNSSSKKT